MARMSPDDRREAIVDAALAVMVRQGVAGTTARDVAAEMGTSSGLVHHYFSSMDDLLTAAFERAAGRDLQVTVDAVSTGADPLARLALFLESYGRTDADGAMQLWLDAWAEAARRPALQRASRRLNEAWQALLADLVRSGVEARVVTCDDPEATAWRLLSLLDGLALQVVAHRSSLDPVDVARWCREQAERDLGLEVGSLVR